MGRPQSDPTDMDNDRGSVIAGYFAKVALVLVLFALVCFDAVSVGVAKVGIEDTARAAARLGAENWDDTKDVNLAFRAASRYAEQHGASLDKKTFKVDAEGRVTLTARKEATTILLYRTKKTLKWAQVSATGSGKAL